MVSPLVELLKKSKWEAFRFGIFWGESDPLKPCHCPVSQRKFGGFRLPEPLHGKPGRKQVLPCEPRLGMVAPGDALSRKVIPYYVTNFGASLVLAGCNMVGRTSVR
jgi:hypothetical protein